MNARERSAAPSRRKSKETQWRVTVEAGPGVLLMFVLTRREKLDALLCVGAELRRIYGITSDAWHVVKVEALR